LQRENSFTAKNIFKRKIMKNITQIIKPVFKTILVASTLFVASCNNSLKAEVESIADEHGEVQVDSNTSKDAQFLAKAAEINLEEIQLGKMAQQSSTRTDVKELGEMMEKEHTDCLKGLTILANKKSVIIPTTLSNSAQDACKILNGKSGADFDVAYCEMMVNGHRDAIAMFEKVSTQSTDADVKGWAGAILPDLHKHLEHAIKCQNKCVKNKVTASIN
jgi:putative membrane protein